MATSTPYRESLKLLLIEDSRSYQIALAGHLLAYDPAAAVSVAGSAEEALKMPWALEPHVVVLDMHLPDRFGLTLVGPLLRRWPRTCIIALSIDDYPQLREAVLLAGASEFVSKLEAVEELVPAVERCMRSRAGEA